MSNKFVKVEKTEDDGEDGVEVDIKTIGDVDPKEMKLEFADGFFDSLENMGLSEEKMQELLDTIGEAFSPENIEKTLMEATPVDEDDPIWEILEEGKLTDEDRNIH